MYAAAAYEQPLTLGGRTFDLARSTLIMGVLNVTPDSFSDGGAYPTPEAAADHALEMIREGAEIIDVGGESTRPATVYGGSTRVTAEEEIRRVVPVIRELRRRSDAVISIDTTKAAVAAEALEAGASIVNDISGGTFDPEILPVTATHDAAMVIMHIRGTPETMQIAPSYEDVVSEVLNELRASVAAAKHAGVRTIIIDPGIGFGKDSGHNLSLIRHLHRMTELGLPVMIGTSRKGFIGAVLGTPVNDRVEGTGATVAAAILNGARIVRVHDVKAMKRIAVMTDAIRNAR